MFPLVHEIEIEEALQGVRSGALSYRCHDYLARPFLQLLGELHSMLPLQAASDEGREWVGGREGGREEEK